MAVLPLHVLLVLRLHSAMVNLKNCDFIDAGSPYRTLSKDFGMSGQRMVMPAQASNSSFEFGLSPLKSLMSQYLAGKECYVKRPFPYGLYQSAV